jgi:spore maturation protein CgeB
VANISHDDFFSQYRLNTSRVQWAAIPAYDQILTTREVNVDEIRPLNPRVEFFPFAYDPSIHRPVPIPPDETDKWIVDVTFVGTYASQRASLLERLVTAVPARYAVYGGSWHKLRRSSPLRRYVRFNPVLLDDQAKALGGAKVALGFLRKENRDDYTQRTFEIPACGGLLLAERTERHSALYREGVEAEFFDPDRPDELIDKVSVLLADESRRERIRQAGVAAVSRLPHTYDHRIARVLELYRGTPLRPSRQTS